MLLSIGYLLITCLIITVLVAVSATYLEHKRLISLADQAASAAADTFSAGGIPATGTNTLGDWQVRQATADYIRESGAEQNFDHLEILGSTGAEDANTARVELSAVVHPPIVNWIVPSGITITADSHARIALVR